MIKYDTVYFSHKINNTKHLSTKYTNLTQMITNNYSQVIRLEYLCESDLD